MDDGSLGVVECDEMPLCMTNQWISSWNIQNLMESLWAVPIDCLISVQSNCWLPSWNVWFCLKRKKIKNKHLVYLSLKSKHCRSRFQMCSREGWWKLWSRQNKSNRRLLVSLRMWQLWPTTWQINSLHKSELTAYSTAYCSNKAVLNHMSKYSWRAQLSRCLLL